MCYRYEETKSSMKWGWVRHNKGKRCKLLRAVGYTQESNTMGTPRLGDRPFPMPDPVSSSVNW